MAHRSANNARHFDGRGSSAPVSAYVRTRDLPRLLCLWPEEVLRLGAQDQAWLVSKLRNILRAERQRGLARHWSYDLTRHAALLRAFRAEDAILRSPEFLAHGAANKKSGSKPAGPAPS